MTVNRFKHLLRVLRFDDRETREERKKVDKFAAIRELFEEFNKLLRVYFSPSECVTVDETLRSFRGRCGFICYMPNKPCKYGILIRDVADANSRYMLGMLPYTGKADQPDPTFHITGAANIVKHLVEPYANSGRNVTVDRLYTSVELAEELLQKNLTYVGTIMTNRCHLPEEAKSVVGRQEHSSQFYWSDGVMVMSYAKNKKKNVLLLSTQHCEPLITADQKKKPEVMIYYNQTKGGIDSIDQMLETYTCRMSTRRWPVVVFLLMLDVAALNGWVILSQGPSAKFGDQKHGGRRAFLRELGLSLIKPHMQLRPPEGMVAATKMAVETVLKTKLRQPDVTPREVPDTVRARCHVCVAEQHGAGYKKARHRSVNKVKQRCSRCKRAVCQKHGKSAGIMCVPCSAAPAGTGLE
ncbi:piggyBac transposable element-derived protein 4-like [Amphibalanus amphitrite]|uniref:piggyBac transposable element-derived protein 4-like n=1 Tax=Amphibalanus amphitrite TaxID=1232801 RepID=UPI001C8FF3ED|nr:piggyBac transposable element-derived protein 4-like [Amphibalanus amphitrite]